MKKVVTRGAWADRSFIILALILASLYGLFIRHNERLTLLVVLVLYVGLDWAISVIRGRAIYGAGAIVPANGNPAIRGFVFCIAIVAIVGALYRLFV